MRKSTLLVSTLIIAAISCKDDDADIKKNNYSFRDQPLAGQIGGVAWTHQSGFVEEETFKEEAILGFDLVQDIVDGEAGCNILFPEGDYVFFDVPNKVGIYEINFDLMNMAEDSQSLTLYDDETGVNHIANEGAIEILTITDTEVTGRIDARSEADTYINGNFTVTLCK
jgi:hypothetical protein